MSVKRAPSTISWFTPPRYAALRSTNTVSRATALQVKENATAASSERSHRLPFAGLAFRSLD